MYNYSFNCSYLDNSSNTTTQDTVYRQEILKAFNLLIYDHEKMMETIDKIHIKYNICVNRDSNLSAQRR